MLQSIRDRATGWVAVAICVLLLLSMALLGVRTYINVSGVTNTAAEVNGVTITREALNIALQRLQRQLQASSQTLPSGLSQEIKSNVLKTLVNNEVLVQAAVKQGYRVSSAQIEDLIKSMPQFQVKGVFSPERFQEMMNMAWLSPAAFLEQMGRSFVVSQSKRGIYATSLALPDEIRSAMLLSEQQRIFSWALLDARWLASQMKWVPQISGADIEKYYDAHSGDFLAPEQVSLDYVLLAEKNLPKIDASSGDSFSRLREKLANLSYEHPDSLDAVVKNLGLTIQSTPLFTKNQGGQDIVSSSEKVREAAFTPDIIDSGSNSDVIDLDPSTSIVFRLKEHLPSRVLPLADVRSKVSDTLNTLAVDKKLRELAAAIVADLQTGKLSLDAASNNYHLTWATQGLVFRNDSKIPPDILNLAFSLPHPSVNKPIFGQNKTDSGYAVISLKDVKESTVSDKSQDFKRMEDTISQSFADLEYDLYQSALVSKAKIKIINAEDGAG